MVEGDHRQLHAAAQRTAVAAAVAALRSRGERVTAPRRTVLAFLAAQGDPLTADEIASGVEPSDVHRATVYRTLDLLVEAGIVQSHSGAGATRFHLTETGPSHQHLHGHCQRCERVVPLPVAVFDDAIAEVREATGFRVDAQLSIHRGLCRECLGQGVTAR